MIDPEVEKELKYMVGSEETVLWAAKPDHKLFSKYNFVLLSIVAVIILLLNIPSLLSGEVWTRFDDGFDIFIFVSSVGLFSSVLYWVLTKPKYDRVLVTDKALYMNRRGIFNTREGRLPHHKILKAKPLFGSSSVATIVYAPVDNMKVAWNRIWDVSIIIGFWVRHSIHIRDVPDMDGLLRLLRDKGNLYGNRHR